MRKTKYRGNWAVRIAGMLLCLTLTSTYLLAGFYAKYTTSAASGDEARVAKWSVHVTNEESSMEFNKAGTDTVSEIFQYEFTVTNQSETAMTYSVEVSFDTAPPENVTLILDEIQAPCDGTEKKYTFASVGSNSGGETTHTLQIQVDYVADDKLIDLEAYTANADIHIIAEQID